MAPDPARTITLSLISHTNVGKTTLARTLLRRDIGEVLDQPHVTDVSEAHTMIEAPGGEVLRLWDTPGFGDSARLLRRLRGSGNPIVWLLSQVWDRFTDRPLWCSQQAVKNVREEADVVLYLVNAAEDPLEAGYVDMEMEILGWIGKPILVLLNQLGPPRPAAEEEAEEERWRAHLSKFPLVRDVLGMDAFARCWVQEGTLLDKVGQMLPPEKADAFERLSDLWREKNLAIFQDSIAAMADQLAKACCAKQELSTRTWLSKLQGLFAPIEATSQEEVIDKKRAMAKLAENLDRDIRATMDVLIRLHGLEGHAASEIFRRLESDYATSQPLSERLAGVLGGAVGAALTGLAADLAAGGFTLGGGAIVGGLLGAAGGAGLAKGYNLVKGEKRPFVRWSAEYLEGFLRSVLLRYLAVAHFGRGRGEFTESEHPKSWQAVVVDVVRRRKRRIEELWERGKTETDPGKIRDSMERVLRDCAVELLDELYPGTEVWLRA